MSAVVLHYLYDPLCGWCYGAAPMVAAVRASDLGIALHGGGLFAEPTRMDAGKASYVRVADARIGKLTGQPFGEGYLDRLLGDPDTVYWSRPPIAAVIAADHVGAGAGHAMLRAIQKAHYVDGRRVADPDTLSSLAAEVGVDEGAFDLAFNPDATDGHMARTHSIMGLAGLRGYPGFALEVADRFVSFPHEEFYGRPAEFARAVVDRARRGAP